MGSHLSSEHLAQRAPLLGSLARLVAGGSALSEREIRTLLLGVDLASNPAAMSELRLWGTLLHDLQQAPDATQRRATVEALLLRGLPEATVLLAVAAVAGGGTPVTPPLVVGTTISPPLPACLHASMTNLDFGILLPGQTTTLEFDVQGGPGHVVVENDHVQVAPLQFGAGTTRLRVGIKPLASGLVLTTLKLVTAGETLEVPIKAEWQDGGAVPAKLVLGSLGVPPSAVAPTRTTYNPPPTMTSPQLAIETGLQPMQPLPSGAPKPPASMQRRSYKWILLLMIGVFVVFGGGWLAQESGLLFNRDTPITALPPSLRPTPVRTASAGSELSDVITMNNANRVVQLARWGEDAVLSENGENGGDDVYQWSPQNRWLAVRITSGLRLYNADTLMLERTITTGRFPVFSPDEHLIASVTQDYKTIQLQEIQSEKSIMQLQSQEATINKVEFSPDGKLLIAKNDDCSLDVWSVPAGTLQFSINQGVCDFSVSADSRYLVENNPLQAWDLRTGEPAEDVTARFSGKILDISEDASTLIALADDGTLLAQRFPEGTTISQLGVFTDTGNIYVQLSPKGKWLFLHNGMINEDDILQVVTGRVVATNNEINFSAGFGISFDANESYIAGREECDNIGLWNLSLLTPVAAQESRMGDFTKMQACSGVLGYRPHRFRPDGLKVALASIGEAGRGEGGKIAVWNTSDGKLVDLIDGDPGNGVYITAFTANKKLLTIDPNYMRLRNIPTGTISQEKDYPANHTVAFGDQRLILSAAVKGASSDDISGESVDMIQTLSLEDLSEQATITLNKADGCTRVPQDFVDYGPFSRPFAAYATRLVIPQLCVIERDTTGNPISSEVALALYPNFTDKPIIYHLPDIDLAGASPSRDLMNMRRPISQVAFAPNGSLLAVIRSEWVSNGENGFSRKEALQIIGVSNTGLQQTLKPITGTFGSIAFSPDGTLLAANTEDGITLWKVEDGTLQETLKIATWGFVFSPDGRLLATFYEGNVELWDVTNARLLHTLTVPLISSLAFSPDGTLLATGSGDGVVRLWGVQ